MSLKNADVRDAAVEEILKLEMQARPFGQGILGETIKGSVNVLEVLWRSLSPEEVGEATNMLKALRQLRKNANTITIFVAVAREANAIRQAFERCGATVHKEDEQTLRIEHENYHVMVRQGKALIETVSSVKEALKLDRPKWVLMSGIAGSLGRNKRKWFFWKHWKGPKLGDVVLATSLASFRIRDKVRGGGVENVGVPLRGTTWQTIPADPTLFVHAHIAAEANFPETQPVRVWEGQIVTGTGIKDDAVQKRAILAEFPGGLAAEEESFIVALFCMLDKTPCAIVRGISDLAEGDKFLQKLRGGGVEETAQVAASDNAAKVVVATVEQLSRLW
jgi:nucleoside phosphorylase